LVTSEAVLAELFQLVGDSRPELVTVPIDDAECFTGTE